MLELHIVNPCFRNNCLESFLSHQLSRLGQRKWILTDSEWYYINVDFNYRLLKIETVIMFIELYITFPHKSYLTILFPFSYFHNLIACVISILQTDARIYLQSNVMWMLCTKAQKHQKSGLSQNETKFTLSHSFQCFSTMWHCIYHSLQLVVTCSNTEQIHAIEQRQSISCCCQ